MMGAADRLSSARRLASTDEILRAIIADPRTPSAERTRLGRKRVADLKLEADRMAAGAAAAEDDYARCDRDVRALEEVIAWTEAGDLRLGRVDGSRLHQLFGAFERGDTLFIDLVNRERRHAADRVPREIWAETQTFLIEHDWAAAFGGATDFATGAFKLPYERSAFEFSINGRPIIMLARQEQDGPVYVLDFIKSAETWVSTTTALRTIDAAASRGVPHIDIACAQIRAVSIALDAQVAMSPVERAPYKANAARIKAGRLPLFDYRRVVLAHRARVRPLDTPTVTHKRPRLHFRRGHWRHFEEHKTWIRWTLVGSPDLGFIDKEYRL